MSFTECSESKSQGSSDSNRLKFSPKPFGMSWDPHWIPDAQPSGHPIALRNSCMFEETSSYSSSPEKRVSFAEEASLEDIFPFPGRFHRRTEPEPIHTLIHPIRGSSHAHYPRFGFTNRVEQTPHHRSPNQFDCFLSHLPLSDIPAPATTTVKSIRHTETFFVRKCFKLRNCWTDVFLNLVRDFCEIYGIAGVHFPSRIEADNFVYSKWITAQFGDGEWHDCLLDYLAQAVGLVCKKNGAVYSKQDWSEAWVQRQFRKQQREQGVGFQKDFRGHRAKRVKNFSPRDSDICSLWNRQMLDGRSFTGHMLSALVGSLLNLDTNQQTQRRHLEAKTAITTICEHLRNGKW